MKVFAATSRSVQKPLQTQMPMQLDVLPADAQYKEHVVFTCSTWHTYQGVWDLIAQDVLPSGVTPVHERDTEKSIDTYRFALKYLEVLYLTFPQAQIGRRARNYLRQADAEPNELIPDLTIPGLKDGMQLWPFQKLAVQRLLDNPSYMLFLHVGLGKTICSLAAVAINEEDPVLVICPNSLKYQWEEEVQKWFDPPMTTQVVNGSKPTRIAQIGGPQQITIINIEAVHLHPELARIHWKRVIIDESTGVKNPQARRTEAVHRIFMADNRTCLSATPLPNGRIEELWGPWKYGWPKETPTYWTFERNHVKKNGYAVVGYKNVVEIKELIRERSFRRRKEQVSDDLPDLITVIRPVELTKEQRHLYDQIRDELLLWLDDGSKKTVPNALAKMTRLKQACLSPELYGGSSVSAKIDFIKEDVERIVEEGEKLLIFSQWSKATRILERELGKLYGYAYVDGDVPPVDRKVQYKRFREEDDVRVFIGTIGANGMGVNLGVATHVLLADEDWVPSNNDQAIGRSAAGGLRGLDAKVEHVHAFIYRASETIEQWIADLLELKRARSNAFVERDVPDELPKITLTDIRQLLRR